MCCCRLRSLKYDRNRDCQLLLLLILFCFLTLWRSGSLYLLNVYAANLLLWMLFCSFEKKIKREKEAMRFRAHREHTYTIGMNENEEEKSDNKVLSQLVYLLLLLFVCSKNESQWKCTVFDYCLFIHSSITICVIIYWQFYIKEMKTMNRFHQARCKCIKIIWKLTEKLCRKNETNKKKQPKIGLFNWNDYLQDFVLSTMA